MIMLTISHLMNNVDIKSFFFVQRKRQHRLLDPSTMVHGFFRIPCQFSTKTENDAILNEEWALMVACMVFVRYKNKHPDDTCCLFSSSMFTMTMMGGGISASDVIF